MVINGGMGTRINGRKSMGKWGYWEIILGGVSKYFLFSSLPGEMIQVD